MVLCYLYDAIDAICSQQYLYNAVGGVGDLMREGRAEPCPYGVGMQKGDTRK